MSNRVTGSTGVTGPTGMSGTAITNTDYLSLGLTSVGTPIGGITPVPFTTVLANGWIPGVAGGFVCPATGTYILNYVYSFTVTGPPGPLTTFSDYTVRGFVMDNNPVPSVVVPYSQQTVNLVLNTSLISSMAVEVSNNITTTLTVGHEYIFYATAFSATSAVTTLATNGTGGFSTTASFT